MVHANHDDLDQYRKKTCLETSRIPGDNGKPNEDVERKILDQAKKVSLTAPLSLQRH